MMSQKNNKIIKTGFYWSEPQNVHKKKTGLIRSRDFLLLIF